MVILSAAIVSLVFPTSAFALTPAADLTGEWSGFGQELFYQDDIYGNYRCNTTWKINAQITQDGNQLTVHYYGIVTKQEESRQYYCTQYSDHDFILSGTIDGSRITVNDFYFPLAGWYASAGIKLEGEEKWQDYNSDGVLLSGGTKLSIQLSPTNFVVVPYDEPEPAPFEQDSQNQVASIKTNKGSATITTTDGKVVNSNQLESGQTIQTGTDTNVEILLKDESGVITLKENTKLGVYEMSFDPNERDSIFKFVETTEGFSDATGLNAKHIGLFAIGFAGGSLAIAMGGAASVLILGTAFVVGFGTLVFAFYDSIASSSEKNQKIIFTPDAILIPHGTKFSVTVENGQTKLDVLEGKVTVIPLNENDPIQIVKAGNSISISKNDDPKERVPGWIKNIAKWWDEGQLDDAEFVAVIQYMVKEKVIYIPDLPKQNIFDQSNDIPTLQFAKTTAKLWAVGEMSEDEFINDSIKSLYEYGIISNENLVEATTVDVIKRGTVQVSIVKESSIPDIVESYNPTSIKVYSGTTATWTNDDYAVHTVTSGTMSDDIVGSMFDSGLIPAGSTWSYKFEKSGEWDYFCTLHPWMEGTVSVN